MSNLETMSKTLKEICYELSLKGSIPSKEELEVIFDRYPAYRSELAEFVAHMALDALAESSEPKQEFMVQSLAGGAPDRISPAVQNAMRAFNCKCEELSRESPPPDSANSTVTTQEQAKKPVINPFVELKLEQFRNLAKAINSNSTFVSKLRDRLIVASTIPIRFIKKLSEVLNTPVKQLKEHLFSDEPVFAPEQYYHATDLKNTSVNKQTFEEAVRNSDLEEEQQKYLLSFVGGEE